MVLISFLVRGFVFLYFIIGVLGILFVLLNSILFVIDDFLDCLCWGV